MGFEGECVPDRFPVGGALRQGAAGPVPAQRRPGADPVYQWHGLLPVHDRHGDGVPVWGVQGNHGHRHLPTGVHSVPQPVQRHFCPAPQHPVL